MVTHLAASPAESVSFGMSFTESGGTSGHLGVAMLILFITIIINYYILIVCDN